MGRGSLKGAWILYECEALLSHGGRGPDRSLTFGSALCAHACTSLCAHKYILYLNAVFHASHSS